MYSRNSHDFPLQVSYDATSEVVPVFCRELAEATGGKFHHFSPIKEEGIFESTDIALLLDEIRAASGKTRRNGRS